MPSTPPILLLLGALLAGACSSTPEAEADWFDGGPMKPTSVNTLQLTARVLATKGDFAGANRIASRMLVEYPNNAESYAEAAELLVHESRINDAIGVLDKGLELIPGNPILHTNRGICLLMLGKLEAATSDFEAAYAFDNFDADFVANLALARALGGNEPEAEALWARVLPPEQVEANLRIARASRLHK